MDVVTLPIPVTGAIYLKMFWTVQRVAPTKVCWEFPNAWARERGLAYLTGGFGHKDQIEVIRRGERSLLMGYVKVVEGTVVEG